jgi:hypothetical protein
MSDTRTPRIKPIHAVFCDDIRQEANGKQILIGVYPSDILVSQLPAPLVIAIWMPFVQVGHIGGRVPIEFRVLDDNERSIGYGSVALTLSEETENGALSFPALAAIVNRGKLRFQLKQYDDPWETVAALKVDLPPPAVATPPIGPLPPSSQSESAVRETTSVLSPSRPASPTRRRRP